MALNLEGLRIECARRMYEKTLGTMPDAPLWFDIPKEQRLGFLRMTSECFQVLFSKNPADVIEFFTGVEVTLVKKDKAKPSYCGGVTSMGHGENYVCGELAYREVYQCSACHIKDLEAEVINGKKH